MNENGYTKDDVEDLLLYFENHDISIHDVPLKVREVELIIDALAFYKEMNYQ